MIIFLLVGLVVFFLAGYKLHHYQYEELVAEATSHAKTAIKMQEKAKEMQNDLTTEKKYFREEREALMANDQERANRHTLLVEENSTLKSQIFLLQRNCSCGGLKRDVPK